MAARTPRAVVAATIYAVALSGLLGASALYHRVTWSPRARFWMGRLDLAMIFLMIAGSQTAIALLALEPGVAASMLWFVWGTAAAGIVLKMIWTQPAKWATATVYAATGCMGALLMPDLARSVGFAPVALLGLGGVLYLLGALVYALQRPDPLPAVFGYHEIFHALVIAAAGVHYFTIAAYMLAIEI